MKSKTDGRFSFSNSPKATYTLSRIAVGGEGLIWVAGSLWQENAIGAPGVTFQRPQLRRANQCWIPVPLDLSCGRPGIGVSRGLVDSVPCTSAGIGRIFK